MFVDTHCHLDAAEFGDSQAALLQAAQAAGVGRIVVPAVARANFEAVRLLCARFPACAPAYGIHPMYVDQATPNGHGKCASSDYETCHARFPHLNPLPQAGEEANESLREFHVNDLDALRGYLVQPASVAVGEIGLDFFIEAHDPKRQEHFFVEQLKLARAFDLPVLLHVRRAHDTILKHLRQHKVTGIAHAFSGSRQQAEEFIKLGFKLGFGGAMTHTRATRLRELAATLPPGSIVLETDAPDIPPDFLQHGQPNKPEYLPRIAQTLAELRGMTPEEVARITTENALAALPKLKAQ